MSGCCGLYGATCAHCPLRGTPAQEPVGQHGPHRIVETATTDAGYHGTAASVNAAACNRDCRSLGIGANCDWPSCSCPAVLKAA